MSDLRGLNDLVDELFDDWDVWQHGPSGRISREAKEAFYGALDDFCVREKISVNDRPTLQKALWPLLLDRLNR